MNAISKANTIDTIIGTVEEIKYILEPVAPVKTSRLAKWFDAITQSSYEAWAKHRTEVL
jgi:hypothetical protein